MDEEQIKYEESNEETYEEAYQAETEASGGVMQSIGGFFSFLGRTTVNYFKGLPDTIRNKIKAKIAEHRRMPKRKSIHKVYVLVGYTTKEYVDRKYRKERALLIIRKALIAAIVVLVLIMTYRWITPKIDYSEYKQMVGVNKINELTQSDPFATETTIVAIAPDVQNVTPIPSNTTETKESKETKETKESQEPV
jgi:hypothetical protein